MKIRNKLLAIISLSLMTALSGCNNSKNSNNSSSSNGSISSPTANSQNESIDRQGELKILQAYIDHDSNFQVQSSGIVHTVLPDDRKGTPHQKFILSLPSGHTVLIAHNTKLAPRIPNLVAGDTVQFYGEYEWNRKGGVIHWTHHDPREKHINGWLKVDGKKYE